MSESRARALRTIARAFVALAIIIGLVSTTPIAANPNVAWDGRPTATRLDRFLNDLEDQSRECGDLPVQGRFYGNGESLTPLCWWEDDSSSVCIYDGNCWRYCDWSGGGASCDSSC